MARLLLSVLLLHFLAQITLSTFTFQYYVFSNYKGSNVILKAPNNLCANARLDRTRSASLTPSKNEKRTADVDYYSEKNCKGTLLYKLEGYPGAKVKVSFSSALRPKSFGIRMLD
jgi:hypothetical protein